MYTFDRHRRRLVNLKALHKLSVVWIVKMTKRAGVGVLGVAGAVLVSVSPWI